MSSDLEYMLQAIRLAKKGWYTTEPNPRVGCIIVNDGKVVGTGWHQYAGQAHAEINALAQANDQAKSATAYVTLEPCSHTGKTPPCADALIAAGVKKVFVAMVDPNPLVAGKGLKKLRAAGIEVESGLLELQARDLNPGFIKRMESGRPFVRVKMAMSLDGRTAMASGESKWISSEASRHDVQCLRADSSAIMTGIGTILADDPSMNVRLSAEQLELDGMSNKQPTQSTQSTQPKRLVLDSQFKMPVDAQIASLDGECIVFTTVNVENKNDYPFTIETVASEAVAAEQVRSEAVTSKNKQIDLKLLMNDLAKKEINLLHVEAGPILSGALLKSDLVDEIILYMAPHIMGDGAKGLFHLPELEQMKDRIALSIKDVRSIGNDIRITLIPEYS